MARGGAWVGCTAVALVWACGGDDGSTWAGTEVDSAGVRVVTHAAVPDRPGPWVLEPVITVGAADGADGPVFGAVTDVEIDGRGRIALLDGPSQVIRLFDSGGAAVSVFGGPGDGPGELSRFAGSLVARGDTLTVVDWGRGARIRFDGQGVALESRPLPGPAGSRSWWRRARDGEVWFRSLTRVVRDDGRWGGDDRLFRLGGDGEPREVWVFRYPETDLGGPGAVRVPLVVDAPSWDVADDGGFAWVTLSDGRLRIHAPDGGLRLTTHRVAWSPEAATSAHRGPLVDALGLRLGALGGDPAAARSMETDLPESLPGVTSVRAGPEGTWWVQRRGDLAFVGPGAVNTPDPPTAWGGPFWDVVGPDGRYRGTVALPPRTRLLRIREGRVIGVTVDDLGVERLAVWRLVPAG